MRDRRKTLLGLAHMAAAQLGLDEDTRRAAQQAFCGKASLREFTDDELVAWCWELKRRGADIGIPAPAPKGGIGWERPTAAQWAMIERLAAGLGLNEAGLRAFTARTCHVDDTRFLTRAQASAVITGLQRWSCARGADTRSRTRQAIEALLGDDG
ncbi:MAG: regulatory protein GemA [Rhodocyclaceae bacterium]|nr:regulatory protein GemA [Rhodocyclaceae bacterium]